MISKRSVPSFLGTKKTEIVTSNGTYTVTVDEKFALPQNIKKHTRHKLSTHQLGYNKTNQVASTENSEAKQNIRDMNTNDREFDDYNMISNEIEKIDSHRCRIGTRKQSITTGSILQLVKQHPELKSMKNILQDSMASQYLKRFMTKNLTIENFLFYTEVCK